MSYYIKLENPTSIYSMKVYREIEKLIKEGVKTKEILLIFEFVAPDFVLDKISLNFHKMKNQIALELRKK